MKINREDLNWAVDRKILSNEQASTLWDAFQNRDRDKPKFILGHVIYYFGAMIIISAMGWFVSNAWEVLGGGGICGVALLYALFFGIIGYSLWKTPAFKIPGGLLLTAAVWMAPLIIYGFQRMMGWWPQGDPGAFPGYHVWVKGSWAAMEVGTILAGIVVLKWIRFPFLTFPIAFSLWYMSMDLTPLLFGKVDFTWDERKMVSMWFGLAILFVTYVVDRKTKDDFAFWGYLFGLIAFWGGLSMMESTSELNKFIYCLINIGLILLSVFLSRRAFAVFGALGVSGYLEHLAHEVFKDSLLFPVALSSIGLLIIFLGVQFQKNEKRIEVAHETRLPERLRKLRPVHRVS